ncbi:LuxR C-terminal-related transcriptional regulator [Pandoraea oxalativorans]|uniref:LuxR family transcriptional regulator n=1 Tax=Pandoraea oxalativorans TaxID=573737 RepID=A0A0E3U9K5_9BURK|nr:LuxR C-terminal-related transcriptional regulator [Pandoraea oxalativorans]AKC72273.1 LuxR family transcriptional regulator [Pandoraea oxalativorans]
MKSESSIISLIQSFPVSASLKDASTGRYIVNNAHNSRQFGVENPREIEGLTVNDLSFRQAGWGKQYAKSIEEHDFLVLEQRSSVIRRNKFLDDSGDAQIEEMTKFPILGARGNILCVATYRHDITRTLPPFNIYHLHRNFYAANEAIDRTMALIGVKEYFISRPTEAQFRVFLLKAERLSNKEISRTLGVSDRTVECHCVAVRNKLIGDLFYTALSAAKGGEGYDLS